MSNVTVYPASNKPVALAKKALPLEISITPDLTVGDVKKQIASKAPKFSVYRQKISVKGDRKPLEDETKIKDLELKDGSLEVKDLGPQVGWRTVFIVEYLGPLVIHPLIFHFPEVFYGKTVVHSKLQQLVYVMVIAHFLKRELETLFVHRFSHGTMPLFNLFKNSGHYHFLSGLLLAYDIYRPTFSATSPYIVRTIRDNDNFLLSGLIIWTFFELSNLITHITVRNLRPAGSKKRAIPHGYGFNLVSFPNYFFETLAWGTICILTGSWASYLFFVVAVLQMAIWAKKKHITYKKEFGKEYPRERKAMIPFIF